MALLDRSAVRHLRPCGGPGCSGAGALRHCPRACRLRRAGRLGPPSPHLSRFRGWTPPEAVVDTSTRGRWSAVALQAQLPIAVRGELVDGQERVTQLVERQRGVAGPAPLWRWRSTAENVGESAPAEETA